MNMSDTNEDTSSHPYATPLFVVDAPGSGSGAEYFRTPDGYDPKPSQPLTKEGDGNKSSPENTNNNGDQGKGA